MRPTFTFHYELIITNISDGQYFSFTKFTFHYELIITWGRGGCLKTTRGIYISLWTNYNT